jgi:hypothetical protein
MLNQQNLPPNTVSRLETLVTPPTAENRKVTQVSFGERQIPQKAMSTPLEEAPARMFEEVQQEDRAEEREEEDAGEEALEEEEEEEGQAAHQEKVHFESKTRSGWRDQGTSTAGVDLDEVTAIRATAQAQIERYSPVSVFCLPPLN